MSLATLIDQFRDALLFFVGGVRDEFQNGPSAAPTMQDVPELCARNGLAAYKSGWGPAIALDFGYRASSARNCRSADEETSFVFPFLSLSSSFPIIGVIIILPWL